MNRVQELLERKRHEVELRKQTAPVNAPTDDRRICWNKESFRIFAEIKRASLSSGSIRDDLTPRSLAESYERSGVSAVSILTEQNYFKGSLEDLTEVRKSVKVPVLQKDFIVDEFQIREAKAAGADFVLLIARFLSVRELSALIHLCEQIRMNAIVEITDEKDLSRLTDTPRFLGVNSRDLETLEVDVRKFRRLRNRLPDSFLIAESGINSVDALREILDLRYHGALIGEHFLRCLEPEKEAARFVEFAASHRSSRGKTRIKICGITNEGDAFAAIEAGADALGFIFAESPRKVDTQVLARMRSEIPDQVACVGVFKDQNRQEILRAMETFSLDIAQVHDPQKLPGVVWHARTVYAEKEIDFQLDENTTVMWDIKAENNALRKLWRDLKKKTGDVFVLAGGLDPENIAEAISICRPAWVDVARGVETRPGKKDLNKLLAFIDAVKTMNDE